MAEEYFHLPSRARVRHVDSNATSVEFLLVEAGNGSISLLLRAVSDKAEPTRATSLAVLHDNLHVGMKEQLSGEVPFGRRRSTHVVSQLTIGGEGEGETIVVGVPRQVSDVNFSSHDELLQVET